MAYPHSYLCTVNSDKQQLNLYIMPIMINRGKEMLRTRPKTVRKSSIQPIKVALG